MLPRANPGEFQMDSFIQIDEKFSTRIYMIGRRYPTIRFLAVVLEYLVHGILWLAVIFTAFLFQGHEEQYLRNKTLLANFFFGIIIDGALCALVKVLVRRQRPHYNEGSIFATVNFDEFSFPSGHSTRGALAWMFFCAFEPFGTPFYVKFLLILAPVTLALSRVLMGRHYLSDVVCGVFLGWFSYILLLVFWLSPEVVNVIWRELRMTVPLVNNR